MFDFLRRLLGRRERPPDPQRLLELESQVQALRLELAEREQMIASLRTELERHKRLEETSRHEAASEAVEQIFSTVAACASQLLLQAHVLEQAQENYRPGM